jgi:hypothetical protein
MALEGAMQPAPGQVRQTQGRLNSKFVLNVLSTVDYPISDSKMRIQPNQQSVVPSKALDHGRRL